MVLFVCSTYTVAHTTALYGSFAPVAYTLFLAVCVFGVVFCVFAVAFWYCCLVGVFLYAVLVVVARTVLSSY